MPEMDGYDVCRQLKTDESTKDIPVIFVTTRGETAEETHGLRLGAVDYLTKPVNQDIAKARIKTHLDLKSAREILKNQNILLEAKVKQRTRELIITQEVTIQCMASLAETRDNETGGHIRRTQNYMRALAEELKNFGKYRSILDAHSIDLLCKSTPLHDIGKVGVSDRILLKPGKLTEEEFEEMKKHTIFGKVAIEKAEIQLGTNSFLKYAKEIAYSHHEKWDGSGYPEGLKGEQIPLSGRFMALVDVYDALISRRIYKPPLPHSEAVRIIREGEVKHFDSDITKAFVAIQDEFKRIALEHAKNEDEIKALTS